MNSDLQLKINEIKLKDIENELNEIRTGMIKNKDDIKRLRADIVKNEKVIENFKLEENNNLAIQKQELLDGQEMILFDYNIQYYEDERFFNEKKDTVIKKIEKIMNTPIPG